MGDSEENIIPRFKVSEEYKTKAKKQLKILRSSPVYNKKSDSLDKWKGLVAEFICSDELAKIYPVQLRASGIDPSTPSAYDIIVSNVKVDVKCATKNHYARICPNVKTIENNTDVTYIGCKYIETAKNLPDMIEIYGAISSKDIMDKCTQDWHFDRNTPYYSVPFDYLKPIIKLQSNI